MGNRRIKLTDGQIKGIEQACKNNRYKNAERRLCVVNESTGKTLDEIVARTEYRPAHALSLVTKYFNEGLEAIIGKKGALYLREAPTLAL